MSHLLLGPIVGHTDHESTRIWIRVDDNPDDYVLQVNGVGRFPFVSTESNGVEFGTAIAKATGLRAEWQYRYQVRRRGRSIANGRGSFRTMPALGANADMLFVTVSCSHNQDIGAWERLRKYIDSDSTGDILPRFLLMIGDQVYHDGTPDVWKAHLDGDFSSASERRAALANTYQLSWSRETIRYILANVPTYMMWDDHDIRDGWGSWATDSPTLAAKYKRGAEIFNFYNAYFEDARDVFWHFQRCHGLPSENILQPAPGTRQAMPLAFATGRLAVLIVDSRGARDLWRNENPILGGEQWIYIDELVKGLPQYIDALAVVTPVPLIASSPNDTSQKMLGDRDDDIRLFKKGRFEELKELQSQSDSDAKDVLTTIGGVALGSVVGGASNGIALLGKAVNWKVKDIDDVRDQWCNVFSRPEQERLLRLADKARFTNRLLSQPRNVFFIGGDLHSGGLFQVTIGEITTTCMITSGIGKQNKVGEAMVGILVNEDYEVAEGIRAKLQDYTVIYNFGVTHITFGANVATPLFSVAREGSDKYLNIKIQ